MDAANSSHGTEPGELPHVKRPEEAAVQFVT